MKKLVVAVAALALALPAWAGPKDKVAETFADNTSVTGNGVSWNNATVTAKLKSGKCKIQIQFKDALAAIEGEQIICIAEADVRTTSLPPGVYGNSVVMAGTVSGGKLKIKADLSQVGCGSLGDAVAFNGGATCYRADANYTDPNDLNLGNWKQVCLNAATAMAPLPSIGDPPLEDDLLGLCQSLNPAGGERIDPPASAVLAVQGSYQPIAP
jgi:hypothetical protein